MEDLFVCSHRGPVSFADEDGVLVARRGAGGLVTALSAVLRAKSGTSWLASALSPADRQVAAGRRPPGGGVSARLLDIPADMHRLFYDRACVTGLGFLFHGLVDRAYTPTYGRDFRAAWEAYREVNRRYAADVVRSAAGRPVLVEDYHLLLVAEQTRRAGGTGPMAYFHHVPWCPPDTFALLPRDLRLEILTGMLAFDTVAFHSRRWADEFLACCEAFLVDVHCGRSVVAWRGGEVTVVVAPAQLDVADVRQAATGTAAMRWRERLASRLAGRQVVARVDRIDLWKNVIRGFQAYEELIAPAGGDVVFLALLAKSRQHLTPYRDYLAACVAEAERINQKAGADVIQLAVADHTDHDRAMAVLGLADVTLVNSTSDGLNLVAKESVIAGDGPLVLSENTGVYEEIGQWCLGVNPYDVEETAAALSMALKGSGRPQELADRVRRNSPEEWIGRRLAGLPGYGGHPVDPE